MEQTTNKTVLEAARSLFSNVLTVHEYKNKDGSLIYAKARRSSLPKVLPFHQTKSGKWEKHEPKWGLNKRPIYNLDKIHTSSGPVWVVEGEKCADALACLGLVATTSGSASSAGGADWLPLKGRPIHIWPDNDDAGRRYAEEVFIRLKSIGCAVEVVKLEYLGLNPKDDCFDWLKRNPNANAQDVEAIERAKFEALEIPINKKETSEDEKVIERLADGSFLLETETANFIVGKSGVFWEKFTNGKREPERLKVCSEIHVLAKTRTTDSSAWGLLLEWKDPDGRLKRWACPRELLVGDAQALRRELASNGLEFGSTKKGVERFEEFLSAWPVKERALCVEKIGWCGDSFVTPNSVFSRDGKGEMVVYQNTKTTKPPFSACGSLDGWKANVSKLAAGNSRLVFAISCAFAGPLLRFQESGDDSGGFNIRGTSSSGKTTALKAAASVYGGPSYVKQWRATTNGLEAIAEAHNDCLLILDELAQIDPQVAGECAYLLANGTGKNRMTKNLSAPIPKEWRLLFLSAGEISLSEHMLEAGKRSKAGQELRLADLPADAGAGMGIVEALNGYINSGELVNHIREATTRNYGHAGKAWLEWLVKKDGLEPLLSIYFKMWRGDTSEICPSGKAARVLARFGLVATAGELATEAGITGWEPGEAWRSCLICANAWWNSQKWLIQKDDDVILDHVRNILETQSARFSDWDTDEIENKIINRLGFRRKIAGNAFELDRYKWLIFRNVWRSEICRGFSVEQVEKTLLSAGVLIPDKNGNVTQAIRSPLGVQRFYVIDSKIFGADNA